MEALWFGPVEVDCCPGCGGTWFDRGELGRLKEALSDEALHEGVLEVLGSLRRSRSSPSGGGPYVPCPVCQEVMRADSYRDVSGLVVYSCKAHGTWADHDEAVELFELFEDGGARLDALVQRSRATRLEERLRRLERAQREASHDIHRLSLRQRVHMTFDMFGFF